jgi:hypothetical protein
MDLSAPAFDELKKDPQAAKLLNDPEGLKALLSSPETQKLMALLNQKSGSSLRSAAQAAARGKPDALLGLLDQVMNDPQGAQAVEELKKKTQQ